MPGELVTWLKNALFVDVASHDCPEVRFCFLDLFATTTDGSISTEAVTPIQWWSRSVEARNHAG